jgi:hypothetical protein
MYVMNRSPEEMLDGGLSPDGSLDASDEGLVALWLRFESHGSHLRQRGMNRCPSPPPNTPIRTSPQRHSRECIATRPGPRPLRVGIHPNL